MNKEKLGTEIAGEADELHTWDEVTLMGSEGLIAEEK